MTLGASSRWDEIAAQLNELRPRVDEYERLQAAATALEGMFHASNAVSAKSRAPRASSSASTSSKAAFRLYGLATRA